MKHYLMLIGIGVQVLIMSCTPEVKNDTIALYHVINPSIIDTTLQTDYVAEIHSRQYVEIRSRIPGIIEQILVDEGQFVRKGQTLFRISNALLRQQVAKSNAVLKHALAELTLAKIELENSKKLYEKQIIGKPELDANSAKVDALNAKVEEMQAEKVEAGMMLAFTDIKSPFAGKINRIPFKVGSLIDEESLLTTVSDNSEMLAYFRVSELDYLTYFNPKSPTYANEVNLILANGMIYDQVGTIEITESEFHRNSGNIAFRARFGNPDEMLKHGSSSKVLVNTPLKNVMIIPQKSTFEIQEQYYVYVIDKANTVQQRKVEISHRLPQLFVIKSGLNIEDKIIYQGVQKLKVGDSIIPKLVSFMNAPNFKGAKS